MTTCLDIERFPHCHPPDYSEVEAVVMLHHHRLRKAELPCGSASVSPSAPVFAGHWSVFDMLKGSVAVLIDTARPVRRSSRPAGPRQRGAIV